MTLELAIKQALEETAPDLAGLEVEGVVPAPAGPALPLAGPAPSPSGEGISSAGFELPMVIAPATASPPSPAPARASSLAPARGPSWFEADHLDLVPVGAMVGAQVAGAELVVANVDGTLLAYANTCADCGSSLDSGELHGGTLACPRCSRTFFLPRAGRSMDDVRLQLEPVPLLREQGHVKVALTL
jgi:nitrite reductase/ring-hydroxylating ferredoxin subunit